MDDFYSSCITNMVQQSCDSHMTGTRLSSFEDVAPLLSKMVDKVYALSVAKWLAEQLKGEEDRTKALTAALAMATQCREMATSEVS